MLKIKIDKKTYTLPEDWHEITLRQAKQICTDVEAPEELLRIYAGDHRPDLQFLLTEYVDFQRRIFSKITKYPLEKINNLDITEIKVIYQKYIEKIVAGIYAGLILYDPRPVGALTIGGDVYILPETKKIMEIEKPFYSTNVMQFAEIIDTIKLMMNEKNGWIKYGGAFLANCLLPENEEYSVDKALQRVELFEKLSVATYMDVFFSLIIRCEAYNSYIQDAFRGGKRLKIKHKQSFSSLFYKLLNKKPHRIFLN